ncbi:MAG: hypothetical protein RLZZ22_22, partial [Pseudomonadota bacterium]
MNKTMQKFREQIASMTGSRAPRVALVSALLAASLLPAMGWAQTVIQSVTSSQQAGTETIRIELNEPLLNPPRGFVLQSPARIALDLLGVVSGSVRTNQEVNLGNLRSLALAQAGDRTRVVLNLRQSTQYRTEQQGKVLLITLEPVPLSAAPATASTAAPAAEAVHFADSQNGQPERIREIDFRRGRDGAGRVVVDLPSTQVGVDIKQQGQNLVVEFLR